jgi:hypothetical protein
MARDTSGRSILDGIAMAAAGTNAVAQPRRGGPLQFVVAPEPSTLVSIDNSFGAASKISPKITEGLATYGLDLRPVPQRVERQFRRRLSGPLTPNMIVVPINTLANRYELSDGPLRSHDGA